MRLTDIENEDPMAPKRMTEKVILFRSVSMPELIDILDKGCVVGGGNRFNEFETRRHVFFGDKIDELLLWQGEDVERQAIHQATYDGIYDDLIETNNEITKTCTDIANAFQRHGIETSPSFYQDVMRGYVGEATRLSKDFPEIVSLLATKAELEAELKSLQEQWKKHVRQTITNLKFQRDSLPYTSAVIETRPLTGGLHYSKSHGKSGFLDNDEYGFRSGEVTIHDITAVHLVKDRTIVKTVTVDELPIVLKKAGY